MRVWLLTNTPYGTWLPGDLRGSVTSVRDQRPGDHVPVARIEHDIPGEPYEEAIPSLEDSARELMTGPPIFFNRDHAETIRDQFIETASYRRHEILALAIMYNHFHMVVRVLGDPDPRRVLADFKAYGSRALNTRFGKPPSSTWWTGKGSKRKLKDDAAEAAGIHYTLRKQPNPLVLWWPGMESEARKNLVDVR
jgi:hypothetical protein